MRCSWTLRFLAVLVAIGWMAPVAVAQDTKTARGEVTALAGNTLSVKAGEHTMAFTVDPKTELVASGAGTAERRAEAAGQAGPRLADFIKVGDAVEVRYQEMGAMMHARRVTKVSSAGSGMTSDDRSMNSTGSVTSVNGSMITISGSSGGGGTFTQSFTVDRETKVVAAGAGTAAAAKGGTLALTDAVGVGDQVRVSYRKAGDSLHAEEIRVTAKKR